MEAFEFLLHGLELRSRFNWRDFLEARKMFRKALEHDEDDARRALDLGPTEATSLADYLRLSGNPEQSIELMRQAMRCDPYFLAFYLTWLGHVYFMVGQYDEATVALRRGIERDTTYMPFHLFLAAT